MGNCPSCNKINFEDMQDIIHNKDAIIINTLPINRQSCLLQGTKNASNEESLLNSSLHENPNVLIVVYGENCCDNRVHEKCQQLINLGFSNVFVYLGGLFEWLLLQDIYGIEQFPTTSSEIDLLKFKGKKIFGVKLLED